MRFILAIGGYKKDVPEAHRLGFWGFDSDHYLWRPTLDTWIALTYLTAKTETCA
ncbi:MAG: hypothetical protein WA667_03820 [Candidatus Nitrosopolaris sp.]